MQPTNVSGGNRAVLGPLTTMLVMDISGSMNENGKIDGAKAAAKAYVDQMRPGDQAGLDHLQHAGQLRPAAHHRTMQP